MYECSPAKRVKRDAYLCILGELVGHLQLVAEHTHALGHFTLTPLLLILSTNDEICPLRTPLYKRLYITGRVLQFCLQDFNHL